MSNALKEDHQEPRAHMPSPAQGAQPPGWWTVELCSWPAAQWRPVQVTQLTHGWMALHEWCGEGTSTPADCGFQGDTHPLRPRKDCLQTQRHLPRFHGGT